MRFVLAIALGVLMWYSWDAFELENYTLLSVGEISIKLKSVLVGLATVLVYQRLSDD